MKAVDGTISNVLVRRAERRDLCPLVRLLASRYGEGGGPSPVNPLDEEAPPGSPLESAYEAAFERVAHDTSQRLLVAEVEGRIAGTLQLTFVPYLAYRGGTVAMIEVFVVDPSLRSHGIGSAMVRACEEAARERGCFRLQLTSHKARTRAHAFYRRLGFEPTHEGFKKALS